MYTIGKQRAQSTTTSTTGQQQNSYIYIPVSYWFRRYFTADKEKGSENIYQSLSSHLELVSNPWCLNQKCCRPSFNSPGSSSYFYFLFDRMNPGRENRRESGRSTHRTRRDSFALSFPQMLIDSIKKKRENAFDPNDFFKYLEIIDLVRHRIRPTFDVASFIALFLGKKGVNRGGCASIVTR